MRSFTINYSMATGSVSISRSKVLLCVFHPQCSALLGVAGGLATRSKTTTTTTTKKNLYKKSGSRVTFVRCCFSPLWLPPPPPRRHHTIHSLPKIFIIPYRTISETLTTLPTRTRTISIGKPQRMDSLRPNIVGCIFVRRRRVRVRRTKGGKEQEGGIDTNKTKTWKNKHPVFPVTFHSLARLYKANFRISNHLLAIR